VPAVFLMLASVITEWGNTYTLQKMAADAGLKISARESECASALSEILRNTDTTGLPDEYYAQKRIGVYYFKGDSLIYWNNSRIPVKQKDFPGGEGITRLNNGYYLYVVQKRNNTTGLALCLVKPDNKLQNNYLQNNFEQWTGLPPEVNIDTTGNGENPVTLNGRRVFSLSGNEPGYFKTSVDNFCTLAFIAGYTFLLILLLLLIRTDVSGLKLIVMIILPLFLRGVMIALKWPAFLYRTGLFDVRLFGNAQSFINGYLGDILLNSFSLLFLAASVYFSLKVSSRRTWRLAVMPLILLFLVSQYNSSMVSLVSNSTLNFDFLNIYTITWPAFVALLAITVYALAVFIAIRKFTLFFNPDLNGFLVFTAINLAVCFIRQALKPGAYTENFWLAFFAPLMFALFRYRNVHAGIALGVHILFVSAVTSAILNSYIDKNQKQDLRILSISLGEPTDPILENEFSMLPFRIARDESLLNLVSILPNTREAVEQLLYQKYFTEYFNRYQVAFSMFDSNCNPLLEPGNPLLLNEGYWLDQIALYSDTTSTDGLFFVKGHRQNSRYIGRVVLGDKRLYVLMEPKQFEEMGSFPDLLLDQSQQRHEKLKSFSYAVYRSSQNTSHYGAFNYPLFLPDSTTLTRSDPAYVHHFFTVDDNTTIIISRNARTWMYFFTFNSYLLLFFSLVTYCCFLTYALLFTSQFKRSSLTRRIQTIIIVLLLVAMSAIGITSTRLVINQFESENRKQLREKTEIIINELQAQFKTGNLFDPAQKDLLNLKLNEFARLFNTDISLFNQRGYLYNTSQPRLYNLGLAAQVANPLALYQLRNNLSSAVAISEKAGNLSYTSLYTPLFDSKKNLAGFINLPYFARQNDLVNELSGIISALINVYVILFVIGILGGLAFSGYITRPLRLIQQQIANISLGKKNEKISWPTNDEIGALIGEYNEMLAKLETSAGLLAQSERESAWREMAKQVAHEIKNPLTPMKLNLQYLQHLMKNDPAAFSQQFEKSSAGIIDQINSLANIANEFSNFARLPRTQLQTINLSEAISTSLSLFENEKNIQIRNLISEPEILVKGDRDQCLRVFNNVVKNAVQAMEATKNARIEVSCEIKDENVIVSVKDNGPGIDAELRDKIFAPNFTTKTTGSGLGLAMVKNIMLGLGGKIWFSSDPDSGTVFYIEFIRA
jgi:signal transduction histidine kinase